MGDQFGSLLVVELTTTNGGTVTLPPDPEPQDECVIPQVQVPCQDKIKATLLRYTGPSLSNATVELVGDSGATATYNNVDLVSGETVLASQNGYTIDSAVSGKGDLGSKMRIFINGVEEKHHTSCSTPYVAGAPAPLDSPKGDPSPNWFVLAFEDKNGGTGTIGADVKFIYNVTNIGSEIATDVVVEDELPGDVPGSPIASIDPAETVMLMRTVFIYETTSNTVTVSGEPGPCEDEDTVVVTTGDDPTPTPTNTPTDADADGDQDQYAEDADADGDQDQDAEDADADGDQDQDAEDADADGDQDQDAEDADADGDQDQDAEEPTPTRPRPIRRRRRRCRRTPTKTNTPKTPTPTVTKTNTPKTPTPTVTKTNTPKTPTPTATPTVDVCTDHHDDRFRHLAGGNDRR